MTNYHKRGCDDKITKAIARWWIFSIEVENKNRGAYSRIEYRWYAEQVIRAEASFVESTKSSGPIKIYINNKLALQTEEKQAAMNFLKNYTEKIPLLASEYFQENYHYLFRAIDKSFKKE